MPTTHIAENAHELALQNFDTAANAAINWPSPKPSTNA